MGNLETNTALKTPSASNVDASKLAGETAALVGEYAGKATKPKRKYTRRPVGDEIAPSVQAAGSPASPSVAAVIDPSIYAPLVGQTVKALIEGVDAAVGTKIYRLAIAGGCDENLANDFREGSYHTKTELDLIDKSVQIIAVKYSVVGQYAPELMLAAVLFSHGARTMFTLRRLSEQVALANRLREKVKRGETSTQSE